MNPELRASPSGIAKRKPQIKETPAQRLQGLHSPFIVLAIRRMPEGAHGYLPFSCKKISTRQKPCANSIDRNRGNRRGGLAVLRPPRPQKRTRRCHYTAWRTLRSSERFSLRPCTPHRAKYVPRKKSWGHSITIKCPQKKNFFSGKINFPHASRAVAARVTRRPRRALIRQQQALRHRLRPRLHRQHQRRRKAPLAFHAWHSQWPKQTRSGQTAQWRWE